MEVKPRYWTINYYIKSQWESIIMYDHYTAKQQSIYKNITYTIIP